MNHLQYQTITLTEIKSDQRFYLRPGNGRCGDELKASVSAAGIITPLLVVEEDDSYTLVHGFRRAVAMTEIGTKRVPCAVLPGDTPAFDILRRLVQEYTLTSAMSPYNVAALLKLAENFSEKERQGLLDLAGVPSRRHPPEAYLPLLALSLEAGCGIDDETISAEVALALHRYPARFRHTLCRIILDLRPSRQGQKELLEATRELARRRGITELSVLEEIYEFCHGSEGNPPQINKALKRFLTGQLYPRKSAAIKEFNRFIASLKLPRKAKLSPSPNFEDDRVTLQMEFPSREELASFWSQKSASANRR